MGSTLEFNDALKISKDRGFPKELTLENHQFNPYSSSMILGKTFEFWNNDARYYHQPPVRLFLVEEIEGKWLYWGHCLVLEQSIRDGKTYGIFTVTKLYRPNYQKKVTIEESPKGKSFFADASESLELKEELIINDMPE